VTICPAFGQVARRSQDPGRHPFAGRVRPDPGRHPFAGRVRIRVRISICSPAGSVIPVGWRCFNAG
jgi:hypothetical protein